MRLAILALAILLAAACSSGGRDVTLAEWAVATCDAFETLAPTSPIERAALSNPTARVMRDYAASIADARAELAALRPPRATGAVHRTLLDGLDDIAEAVADRADLVERYARAEVDDTALRVANVEADLVINGFLRRLQEELAKQPEVERAFEVACDR